jgi:O-antigen/teichoic acid export membrane protein
MLRASLRVAVFGGLVLLALCLAGWLLIRTVPNLRPAAAAVLVMTPALILAPMSDLGDGLLRALDRPKLLAVISGIASFITAGLTVASLILTRPWATLVAATRSAGAVVGAVLLAFVVVSWFRPHRSSSRRAPSHVKRLLRFGTATLFTAVFAIAIDRLDVFVLGISRGPVVVALYAPAAVLAAYVLALPPIIGAFYLPVVSRAAARQNADAVRGLYHWASRWSLVLCSPAIVPMLACPTQLMRLAFGSGYAVVGGPLRILALGVFTHIMFGFNGLTLDAYGLPGVVLVRQVVCLCFSVVACALLIPWIGISGAALATTSSLVLANILCSATLFRRTRIAAWDRGLMITTVSCFVATAIAIVFTVFDPGDLPATVFAFLAGLLPLPVAYGISSAGDRESIHRFLRRITPSEPNPRTAH